MIPALTIPALLIFTIVKNDSFQQWCTLHAFYDNSQGLKKGSQVSMSGTTIGHVTRVELIRERKVHVAFNVHGRYKHLVRKDTKVHLRQRGLMGDWELELSGGTHMGGDVDDNDTLATEKAPALDDMIALATGVIDTMMLLMSNVSAIVGGIEAGEGTIGQILKNDTLFRHITQVGANTVRITDGLDGIIAGTHNTVRGVDTLLATLTEVGKGGVALVDSIMALLGTVNNSVEEVGEILKNVKTISDDVPELMNRLQDDLGEVEMMLRTFQGGRLFRWLGGSPPTNPHLADSP
jgi:phospholipid/cholesterol/gamma-HCH transport system substrate-binding protein